MDKIIGCDYIYFSLRLSIKTGVQQPRFILLEPGNEYRRSLESCGLHVHLYT